MDALDAHPGKGREEEIVQQPCNNGAEKLPRETKGERKERGRFYKFIMCERGCYFAFVLNIYHYCLFCAYLFLFSQLNLVVFCMGEGFLGLEFFFSLNKLLPTQSGSIHFTSKINDLPAK